MRLRHWLAFAGLVLLSATRWLAYEWLFSDWIGVDSALSVQRTLIDQSLGFAALALLFALISFRSLRALRLRQLAVPTTLFFAVPVLASALALDKGRVDGSAQILVFTLLPIAIIIAVAQQTASFGPAPDTRRLLIPALGGAFGALLLVPAALPTTVLDALLFAVVIAAYIAAALAGVRLHRVLSHAPILASAAIACAISAVVLAAFGRIGYQKPTFDDLFPEAVVTVVLDAPILLLTLYLLREMPPIRFASRYLIIPLLAILEGLFLMRPPMTLSTLAGLGLMAGGGGMLLLTED